MKKTFLLACCLLIGLTLNAQDKRITIKSATTSSAESGHSASNAIDGNTSTIWHSTWKATETKFPVIFTITLKEATHVDYIRYIPRQDADGNTNGNWNEVYISYCPTTTGENFTSIGSYILNASNAMSDLWLTEEGITCGKIKFTINYGDKGFASAAEIEAYAIDNSAGEAYAKYFTDKIYSQLKPGVTSSDGIEDATLKTLVDNMLNDAEGYKKFRVGEYEPYLTTETLINTLKLSSYYNNYENPTGVYLKAGESCLVAVSGISSQYSVGLTIKNWVENEYSSTYSLRNGLNQITATTEGNVFVHYYTDDFENAPNVKIHFINAPVQGYWDQATMTNADWIEVLKGRSKDDNTILITRSEHAQLAYPVSAWLKHCPTNIDSTMTLYQQVQWAERDILGLEKYGRQVKNRQLFYATTYGFMAAGGEGSYCEVGSLGAIMIPDAAQFDFWGVGHEWGHNNQVTTGFKWSGCGETTNNIYASWGQIHFTGNPSNLRLEDEVTGIDEYTSMRGGRMKTYFEEGLRKGVAWQLQDGPDYHGATPDTKTVTGYDYNGNSIGQVTTTSRNYDHFVKLSPFWQLNLWGTMAGKCPDIIPMVHEGIRTINNYTSTYNTNGKQQINWMKLACDSAKIDLLPFFEKAGMLKPINAYIEDYGAGWNKINQTMIDNLKKHVASKGYPAFTEEINYINGHNFHIYRDNLKLSVPSTLGTGCTYSNGKVKVLHSQVKNAVAFETYNKAGELIRITMYGLGSNDAHDHTYVLYPGSSEESKAASYIMAVGYDGTRQKIYEKYNYQKALEGNKFYTIVSKGKGGALSCGSGTSISTDGNITWNLQRASLSTSANFVWFLEKRDGKTYLYNPQSDSYFTGTANSETMELCPKSKAPYFDATIVSESENTYTFNMNSSGQYMNSHTNTITGLWSGGSSDVNNIWKVEEVKTINLTIQNTGYYNACCPFAIEIPESIQAYVVGEVVNATYEGEEFSYAVLDKVGGNIVPARMPVILMANPGSYTATLIAEDSTPHTTPNILKGSTLKLTGLTKGTIMSVISASTDAGCTGMMKPTTGTTVAANRAYLLNTDFNNAAQVYLQTRDVITDINDINATEKNVTYYELNGTRATKLQGGRIYITSTGKRILVK